MRISKKGILTGLWLTIALSMMSQCFAVATVRSQSTKGMVVSAQALASKVGSDILAKGGNAIDAAVAVGYALAVVHPCCGNIGGGGFMILHLADGKNTVINFREKAPGAINAKMFLDKQGNVERKKLEEGFLAVGVPGSVLGLNTALKRYGTMPLKEVMAPAIRLAKEGFRLSPYEANALAKMQAIFLKHKNVAKIFLDNGKPYPAGAVLKQTDLAKTLQMIAKDGSKAFYDGPIAKAVVKAAKAHGGLLSLQDFKNYHITEVTPITCSYRGYQVYSVPPPSSGGVTLCEMLQVTEHYPLKYLGYHSAASVHYATEAMRYAYADRNHYLGDPEFVKNPIAELLSEGHTRYIINHIARYRAGDSLAIRTPKTMSNEGHDTTSYSVIDKNGNAVAVTYTINYNYGARVIAGDTGFLLNNELDDFAVKPGSPNGFGLVQGAANSIAPGKRPLSSMTPTIVLKDKKPFLILGSPGGATIITTLLQTIENVIDFHMNIKAAVNAPRFHMQWLPDEIFTEPHTFSEDTVKVLEGMGYKVARVTPFNSTYIVGQKEKTWGACEAIQYDASKKIAYGANDGRRPYGAAIGVN